VGLFSGRPASPGSPEPCTVSVLDDDASRKAAELTERENPGWIVLFGSFTRQFVCFPRFPAPAGTIITALCPDAIPPRMRMIERALRVRLPRDETT
jgi:hypothetical protein